MKGKSSEDAIARRNSETQNKSQKRPAKTKSPATTAAVDAKKLRKESHSAMPTPTPSPPQQQPHPTGPSACSLPEEISPSFDGALEFDGWSWGAVDEDKLLGWFPFVDEDFPCFYSENRGGSPGFFWEDYHDIWHLKHIHEIPSSENR